MPDVSPLVIVDTVNGVVGVFLVDNDVDIVCGVERSPLKDVKSTSCTVEYEAADIAVGCELLVVEDKVAGLVDCSGFVGEFIADFMSSVNVISLAVGTVVVELEIDD